MNDPLAKLRISRIEESEQRSPGAGRWLRWGLGLLLLVGLLAGGTYGALALGWVSGMPEWFAVPEAIRSRHEVRRATVRVARGRLADATVRATGYLESRRQAKIGARAPGRIQEVYVEEGSRVQEREVLAVLEHADLDAALAAASAASVQARAQIGEQEVLIVNAKRNYDRAKALIKTNSISNEEFDQAQYEYDAAVARLASLKAAAGLAEARVREAEQMKENMFVRAPFDGTVISKDGEVGESILPGGMGEASGRGSVVTIADLEHLEVDCDVKEDFINRVHVGQSAAVKVDAVPDKQYQGQVRKIIPMGDRARATIKVKVSIVDSDDRLFPDMSATVFFLPDSTEAETEEWEKDRVFCASEAVNSDATGTYVWLADADDRLRRQPVEAGETRDGSTEILAGLSGSERVVIAPPDAAEGEFVKLVE